MNIVEHNDNLSTKEPSEVEAYLLRIIHRYFDMLNVDNKRSIESMIVESLTRMKRDILHERSFVFSVNGRAGHLALTINDFGGEPVFNKNTAFNKDFTPAGQFVADTICEGNDPRLYDARTPNQHNHQEYNDFIDTNGIPIVDTAGKILYRITPGSTLEDLLNQGKFSEGTTVHAHINYDSVLKKLRYTGNRSVIDLAYLDIVKKSLITRRDDANTIYENFPAQLSQALAGLGQVDERSKNYYDFINKLTKVPPGWYDDAIEYTDQIVKGIEKYCQDFIDSLISPEYLSAFLAELNKYLHAAAPKVKDVPIKKTTIKITGKKVYMRYIIPVDTPPGINSISKIDAYFKYEDDVSVLNSEAVRETIIFPLPFMEEQSDGSIVSIRPVIVSNGTGYIECETICNIPSETFVNYKDEKLIYIYQSSKTLAEAIEYVNKRNCDLCAIDSREKLDFVMDSYPITKDYFIGGIINYASDDMGGDIDNGVAMWHHLNKNIPMDWTNWANGHPVVDPYTAHGLVLRPDTKIETLRISSDEEKPFLYEYIPRGVEDFYWNPRIDYQVFVGGGSDSAINSGPA